MFLHLSYSAESEALFPSSKPLLEKPRFRRREVVGFRVKRPKVATKDRSLPGSPKIGEVFFDEKKQDLLFLLASCS